MWIIDWLKPKWDQRKFPRLRSYCLINYSKRIGGKTEPAKQVSNIRDISQTGLQFTTYEPLKKGDALDVKINLPDSEEPISALARVMWTKKLKGQDDAFRVGVFFLAYPYCFSTI